MGKERASLGVKPRTKHLLEMQQRAQTSAPPPEKSDKKTSQFVKEGRQLYPIVSLDNILLLLFTVGVMWVGCTY